MACHPRGPGKDSRATVASSEFPASLRTAVRTESLSQLFCRRAGGLDGLGECMAIVPGHPARGLARSLPGVPLQFRQVLERVDPAEFARVNETHEQIADFGPVQRAIEQGIFAMQHRSLQRPFTKVVIEWGIFLSKKGR